MHNVLIKDDISVVTLESSGEMAAYFRFAEKVYQKNPVWVPQILSDAKRFLRGEGKFFSHCKQRVFAAKRGKTIVAALEAFYDANYEAEWHEKAGFLGFFEAMADCEDAVRALVEKAEEFLRAQGAEIIYAPFNGMLANPVGLLANAYEESPLFLMPYNPAYYHDYMKTAGYWPEKYLAAYTMDLQSDTVRQVITDVLKAAKPSDVRIRRFDKKRFREEGYLLAKLYSQTFKEHWGYSPQKEDEFFEILEPFKPVLDADLVWFAEAAGEAVGFTICVPDFNPAVLKVNGDAERFWGIPFLYHLSKVRHGRLIAIGVSPDRREKGIGSMIMAHAYNAMIQKGYSTCEYSWVLEDNISSHQLAQKFHGEAYKDYIVYAKRLT
ncbi:MAG: GNAT family N-acetyltransferase [Candidatus Omnitrophota bacterium]|nr:GNAT family N-acetyltransferase [Candidatus Omnitrophota bacterium]